MVVMQKLCHKLLYTVSTYVVCLWSLWILSILPVWIFSIGHRCSVPSFSLRYEMFRVFYPHSILIASQKVEIRNTHSMSNNQKTKEVIIWRKNNEFVELGVRESLTFYCAPLYSSIWWLSVKITVQTLPTLTWLISLRLLFTFELAPM